MENLSFSKPNKSLLQDDSDSGSSVSNHGSFISTGLDIKQEVVAVEDDTRMNNQVNCDVADKQQEIEQLEASNMNLIQRLNLLKLDAASERKKMENQNENLIEELQQCKEAGQYFQKENEELEKKLELQGAQLAEAIELNNHQESTIENHVSTIQQLRSDNELLQSRYEEINGEFESAQDDFKRELKMATEGHVKNEELKMENEELATANRELQFSNENLAKLNEELKGKNEELTKMNREVELRVEELENISGELLSENKKLSKIGDILEMDNRELTKKNDLLDLDNFNLTSEVDNLSAQITKLEKLNGELEMKNKELEKENGEEHKLTTGNGNLNIQELTDENNDLKLKNEELEKVNRDLKIQHEELTKKIRFFQRNFNGMLENIRQCMRKEECGECQLKEEKMKAAFLQLEAAQNAKEESFLKFYEERNAMLKCGIEAINADKKKSEKVMDRANKLYEESEKLEQQWKEAINARKETVPFMERFLQVFADDEGNPNFSVGLEAHKLMVERKLKMEQVLVPNQFVSLITITKKGETEAETVQELFSTGYGNDAITSFKDAVENFKSNQLFMKKRNRGSSAAGSRKK